MKLAPDLTRLPPQDLDAERSVIGSILLSENARDEVALILKAGQFYTDPHRRIYAAIMDLYQRGDRGIDAVTLGHELERRGELAEVGGAPYILQCLETVPHAGHAAYYAKIVRETAFRRDFLEACNDGLRAAYSGSDDSRTLAATAETKLHALIESGIPQQAVDLTQALAEVFDAQMQERRQGVLSGFRELDDLLDGFKPGSLNVLAARPSQGKTALAVNVACNIAREGGRVFIQSLEQPRLELSERMLSTHALVSFHSMRKGLLEEADQFALTEASNELGSLPIRIDDQSYVTPSQISAQCRLECRRHGLKLLIIDYLQLIECDEHKQSREQEVASVCRKLKCMAKELGVAVLLLAQLNRQVDTRTDYEPRLSDLRESGAIEQDSDTVMFVWRPELYDATAEQGLAFLKVAKNRNGPLGKIKLTFRANIFRFDAYASTEQAELAAAVGDFNWEPGT